MGKLMDEDILFSVTAAVFAVLYAASLHFFSKRRKKSIKTTKKITQSYAAQPNISIHRE
jgi:hypothetical protein